MRAASFFSIRLEATDVEAIKKARGSSPVAIRGWSLQRLADDLFFQGDGAGTAGWTLDAIAELTDINLQFADGAAESVAVHAQFAGGATLIAFVFLQNCQDKAFLKLAHSLGIKNITSVHLQNKRFQLIFHDASLSLL
jgi:hypothetical protein